MGRLTGTDINVIDALSDIYKAYKVFKRLEEIENVCEQFGHDPNELSSVFRRLKSLEAWAELLSGEKLNDLAKAVK